MEHNSAMYPSLNTTESATTPLLSKYPGNQDDDMITGYQSGMAETYGNSYDAENNIPHPQIVVIGGCPACRVGVLDDHYTCGGIMCAIFLFPLGILCCLASRQRRCNNCGAVFG